jgi:hypothetical protein
MLENQGPYISHSHRINLLIRPVFDYILNRILNSQLQQVFSQRYGLMEKDWNSETCTIKFQLMRLKILDPSSTS